ncbi:DDE superfamily endonuclease [Phytophthora infestans]|uniref:DDE superfamily endonuclease n=1 Tax=Phytophthora infestans TaxID=4787 RepID=A0A8S9V1Z5_PHYIN|nr:DDE superfamily endonuclease [Phytophthora infestans]
MGRDDFPLKTSHVLLFVKEEYPDFLNDSLARNKEESLGRLIRWLIYQQGFSFRRPTKSILSTVDLEAEQRAFASQVGTKVNATYARSCIFNADETAVYYDAKPTRIISERGAKKSVKIRGRTRSERARKPGGRVEEEVRGISSRVVTAVQRNAWMDSRLWLETFVEDSWGCFMSSTHPGPMALYVDNLQCHVSTEPEDALATWGTELVPLPKNTTSVLQPLDVGVMGPFKQKLRAITLVFELGAVAPSGHLPLRERLLAIERMSALEKRKRLVERVIAAWDAVSEDTIKKAWLKAGL